MSRIESTDMSNEQAVATHTALMLGQKQAIYRGSKDGLRVYYLTGEKYPDPNRKEEAVFFVVDEETGKYAVMTHADLKQERLERQNGVAHTELGEDSDYLEHYGIKGQKWGIRRFQNKDGSLTKAGLKRYSDTASTIASTVGKAVVKGGKKVGEVTGKAAQAAKEKISEKHAQRKEEKRIEKLMSKPIRKLTEEERIERMDRKMKEKELRTLEKNVRDLSDGAVSKGRKFLEDIVTKVAIPSVISASEKQLTAFLNKKLGDALGLGDKDSNLMQEVLSGNKQLKDLSDGEINKLGKSAESWGNVNKFIFGKNADQNDDSGPSTTYLKDLISGKAKMSDFDDKTAREAGKTAEAAEKAQKFADKFKQKDEPESDSKPKAENEAKAKTESDSKPKAENNSKPKAENKPKSKDNPDMDRILNSNINDLSNEDLAIVDDWLKSINW